jgi:tetratricopeptide (TPR) repeat protein
MIKIKIFAVIFLTLLLLQAGLTYGQDEAGGLFVSGRITTEQGNVGGAVIKLFRNGQPMVDYQVDNTGRFNLRFEFNNEYVLIFQRPDNFPQKYTVSTVVPANVLQRDRKFPPYPLDVNLFTEIKGVNKSFSENTVLRIYYSPAVDNFIHETYYNNAQIKKLIDQAILQSQSVNREAELLKRLSASELAALKRDYDAVLKKAGTEFDKGEYLLALDNYKIASRIFPAEQFPKDRIAEINDLIAVLGLEAELEKQQAEKYNQFIRQADQQFSAQQYEPSKKNYTQALYVRPGDSHATGRIAEIDRIVEDLKARQQYADIIAIADKAFKEKLWDESRRRYQEAMQSRPGESYPAAQIARIDEELQKLSQLAEKQSTFEAAVLNGDASYAKQFYPKALEFYRTALSIRPDDQAVLAKIAKVEKEQKDINDRLFYDETIANADRAFKRLEYTQARELYSSALTVRPDQTYPMRQIEAIDKIAERERDYENLIASGDAGMASGNYSAARDDFRKALEIKSGEKYPAQKIKEIDVVLAGQAKEDQQYRQLLATADKFFNANQFPQAKAEYQKASSQRPADNYPQEMLGKIAGLEQEAARLAEEQRLAEENRLSADQQQRDNRYQALVNEADRLVDGNELVAAVSRFRDALEVKPQESYPLQRIEEIRGIITRQTEAQKTYDTAIAAADRAFQQQRYPEARSSYQQAQQAKPSEGYPGEQLAKIDGIEAEQARQLAERQAADEAARLAAMEAKDREYAEVVGRADNLFKEQQYPQAIAEYRKAQQVKPEESYPAQQIAEADRLNSAMQAAQKAYDTAIAAADRAFQQQRYPEARSSYQQAQQAKPSEGYPGEQLSKIDGIEAEQARQLAERQAADEAARLAAMAAKDREYAEAVGRADNLFKEQQYPQAIAEYRKAQQVKQEESYPAQQIAEADRLNSAMQAAQKAYDTAIAAADRAFQQQRYPEARSSYQQAQQAKPSEGYPGEQLSKIDGIEAEQARQLAERQAADEAARLAAMAAKDREYAEAVGRADNLFKEQQYPQAIAEYRKAQQVKPEESYPAQQIAEADRMNSAMQAAQKAYDTAIAAADRAFQQQRYPEARSSYQQAQQAKPSEGYPGEQLAKIDGIEAEQARQLAERQAADEAARLAAMAAKDREYAEAVGRADNLFKEQQYPQAIAEYRKAQQVKPEESYPAQQISEADRLNSAMQAAEARNREYVRFITLADRAFNNQEYNPAAANYRSALQAKPDETYPQERLEQIENIQKQRETDERYRQLLLAADGFFRASEWNQARGEYEKASDLKTSEEYPKEQIRRIDETLEKLAQRTAQAQPVAEVPASRQETASSESRVPAPSRQITDESDALYQSMLTVANESFDQQQYNVSRAWYYKALEVKPGEQFPNERISEINRLLGSMQLSQREREFQQFINQGDEAFRSDQLAVARGWYNRALTINPNDEYARAQIVEIQQEINSRLQGGADQVFAEYIKEGDKAFGLKNYSVARVWYQRARQLKPGDPQTMEKLDVVRKALAGEVE